MGGRVLRVDVDFLWGGAMVYGVGGFEGGGMRRGCTKLLCELAGGWKGGDGREGAEGEERERGEEVAPKLTFKFIVLQNLEIMDVVGWPGNFSDFQPENQI